ncbi:hypothetical protein N4301_14165, partial [Staphylococcus aureus]|nr:hypothetical protein [Staphylococcus aureus]
LFLEKLKSLKIKHDILSFCVDAFDSDEHAQPYIINDIINYDYSTFEKDGPRILALEPQDDNLVGVAIRVASERLMR